MSEIVTTKLGLTMFIGGTFGLGSYRLFPNLRDLTCS